MIGILLAAGFSRRFGTGGNKLLHPLPDGSPVGLAAGRNLIHAIPCSVAVVRPENPQLAEMLRGLGFRVLVCTDREQEMADSLAAAVRFTAGFAQECGEDDSGLVIALADMPFIQPQTIASVAGRLLRGAPIVVPTFLNQRGHPVGFSERFRPELEALQGDEGARSILKRHADEVQSMECGDAGILSDIDTPADLSN